MQLREGAWRVRGERSGEETRDVRLLGQLLQIIVRSSVPLVRTDRMGCHDSRS
jgi:hypothetical protein